MSDKFIPNGDTKFADMAEAFARTVARDPRKFAVSEVDSEMLSRWAKEFRDALTLARGNGSRTPSAIGRKNETRKALEEIVRRLANVIRASDRISAADKRSVFIRERPKKLGKRTVPFAPPNLFYQGPPRKAGPNSGLHQLYVEDGFSLIGRSKPNGAVRVELFVDLVPPGQKMPSYPGEHLNSRPWYLRSFTKSPFKVQHPVPPVPMMVVYWARWADAKGSVGPFSRACRADWVGPLGNGVPLLGAMPEVKVLENDMKHLTAVAHLRQLECVSGQKMLPDTRDAGEPQPAPKQLPMDEAA